MGDKITTLLVSPTQLTSQSGPSDLSTTTKPMPASKESSATTPPAKPTLDHHSDPTSSLTRAPHLPTLTLATHPATPPTPMMTRRSRCKMMMKKTTPVNSSRLLSTRSSVMEDTRESPLPDSPPMMMTSS